MKTFRPMVLLLVVVAAFGACSGTAGDAQAFCDKQEEIDALDPSNAEALTDAIQDVAGDAPSEIADDVQTVADALTDLEGVDDPTAAAKIMSPDVQAASERVSRWVDENCEKG